MGLEILISEIIFKWYSQAAYNSEASVNVGWSNGTVFQVDVDEAIVTGGSEEGTRTLFGVFECEHGDWSVHSVVYGEE